jgi:hypothetical protein
MLAAVVLGKIVELAVLLALVVLGVVVLVLLAVLEPLEQRILAAVVVALGMWLVPALVGPVVLALLFSKQMLSTTI